MRDEQKQTSQDVCGEATRRALLPYLIWGQLGRGGGGGGGGAVL